VPREPSHGMGRGVASAAYGRRRAPTSRANGGEAEHRPAVGRDTRGTGLLPRPPHPYLATVRETPRTDRRSEAGLGMCAPGGGLARRDDVSRRRARGAISSFEISFSSVRTHFSPDF
jgi:hypothetical protein